MGTYDKVKKFSASRPRYGSNSSTRGIFHTFNTGDNIIRLVGEFIEVKTHFIAPVKSRGEKGLCMQDAFEGEDKLPQVVNCPDWDIENEKPRATKQCPICALQRAYREASKKPGIAPEEKARFEEMAGKCAARTALKWNIIDREDPYIVESTDKGDRKVLGFKIATIGMEAWNDIEGIFTQCGFDISDAEQGIDINVCRTEAKKTSYSARAVLEGLSVKKSPLTAEELELQQHDLRRLCGKQTDPLAIRDALHSELMEDLRQLGGLDDSEGDAGDEEGEVEELPRKRPESTKSAPATPASKTASFASKKSAAAAPTTKEESAEDEELPWDKEDEQADEEGVDENTPTEDADEDDKPVAEPEESEWQCFGTIDPEHPECKSCESRVACAEKKGVALPPEKKVRK